MAKGAYIGVDNVAHKIKKGYIGVDGVARKIKKAYIGIGGVARPCWGGGELAPYGAITALSVARSDLTATTVGNYALFAGGSISGSGNYSAVVDAYNKSLTRSIPTQLSQARMYLLGTTVGNYALFAAGNNQYKMVDAYNTSLTRSSPTELSSLLNEGAATTVGDYALFGGMSSSYGNIVNAYNKSLTRSIPTELSVARYRLAATTVGDYALFGGGFNDVDYNVPKQHLATVDAYNKSLTRSTPTELSVARYHLAATAVGDYALFGGGYYNKSTSSISFTSGGSTTVDAYNKSLTRSTPTELSAGRGQPAATTVGDYALFGGGTTDDYDDAVSTVDAYDTSLTRSSSTGLSVARYRFAATTVGDYAIFGGGYTAVKKSGGYGASMTVTHHDTVDAYVVA